MCNRLEIVSGVRLSAKDLEEIYPKEKKRKKKKKTKKEAFDFTLLSQVKK